MLVGSIILGGWGVFEEKAKRWMQELGLKEEDPEIVVSKAIREAMAA